MSRRVKALLSSGAGAVFLCTILCVNPSPPHHINKEGLAELRKGMTLTEVITVLGVPPGNYSSGLSHTFEVVRGDGRAIPNPLVRKQWVSSTFAITVLCDAQGTVVDWYRPHVYHLSHIDLVRRMLGLDHYVTVYENNGTVSVHRD